MHESRFLAAMSFRSVDTPVIYDYREGFYIVFPAQIAKNLNSHETRKSDYRTKSNHQSDS